MTSQLIAGSPADRGVRVLTRESETEFQLKRVAAYCRVSTDMDKQSSSLETQMSSFREFISSRPGWQLAGVYADEGLTGTNAARRVEFQRMIADCEAGKIDYILTKSISRFARNTMDCLQYARMLKDMGVYVYFDENRFDTGGTSSEMLLSILAAVAQEESHSLSENMKWGIRKRFEAGKPKWTLTYGFKKGDDGEYRVNEEQAKTVRRIFDMYVAGNSLPVIARTLEKDGVKAMNGGKWWPKTLAGVIHNEKYVGDVLMQKSYTIDHLSHKKVKNDRTVVPSFYIKDHHEAIVDRKTFETAQTIASLKDSHMGCTQYPYHERIVCPFCGQSMMRFHLPIHSHPPVWTCGGENSSCPAYVVHEKYIDRIVRDAYAGLNKGEIEKLALKRGEKGSAALSALEWLNKQPSLKSVEYVFLDALVARIYFAKWNEAVVAWKFGLKSRVAVRYSKASEIPNVRLCKTKNGFTANGEKLTCFNQVKSRVTLAAASCERARVKNGHGRPNGSRKNPTL